MSRPQTSEKKMMAPLSLEDCRCPVCLEIFMEPVTLPCTHTFCKECFLETVEKAAMCCPLCRRRVSVWARLHSKNNSMVNQKLWTQIQNQYPLQCEGRRRGQEVTEDDSPDRLEDTRVYSVLQSQHLSAFVPYQNEQNEPSCQSSSLCLCGWRRGCSHTHTKNSKVSEPGSVRQEYEEQISKLTEEQRLLQEEQSRQSEEMIMRLLEEEKQQLQEETRRRNDDERLARLLSSQLVNVPVSKKKKDEQVCLGQMDRFVFPRPKMSSPHHSSTHNKENIILREKEQRAEGDASDPPSLHLSSSSDPPTLHLSSSDPPTLHLSSSSDPEEMQLLPLTPFTPEEETVFSKRKSDVEEEKGSKRVCSSSSSSSCGLQDAAELESEFLTKLRQEAEDRQLAMVLQKQLYQEERQRATDRRKGSSDAYLLRQDRRSKGEEHKTPQQPPKRRGPTATSSSTPCSPSSSNRGGKQKTLTEMFSSLNK